MIMGTIVFIVVVFIVGAYSYYNAPKRKSLRIIDGPYSGDYNCVHENKNCIDFKNGNDRHIVFKSTKNYPFPSVGTVEVVSESSTETVFKSSFMVFPSIFSSKEGKTIIHKGKIDERFEIEFYYYGRNWGFPGGRLS